MNPHLASLRRDRQGSVMVEFALVGPVLITMLMGVLQIGIGMQNYNALRSVSADVARIAVINYQVGNKISTESLAGHATAIATAAPYGLDGVRFKSSVTTAATQRVTGATELTIKVDYRVPTMLSIIGIGEIPLTYTRPIFVVS